MFNFSRKDTEFFDLFRKNAEYFHLGAVMLDEIIKDPNKSLDREDIYSIAGELATGVDMLNAALQQIIMYRAGHATEKSSDLTALVVESTRELVVAFALMVDIKKNQRDMLNSVHKIASYEKKGDSIYREDISLLFDDTAVAVKGKLAGDAIIHLIKWKDIVSYIEQTLDHCKKISDMILGVVMKYA